MGKYSKAELKRKAMTALAARDAGDYRWGRLLLMLEFSTGLSQKDIERNISALAES